MARKPDHHQTRLKRLREGRDKIAALILEDAVNGPNYMPIFERLDRDVKNAEAALTGSPLDRVRAMSRQKAIR